MVGQEVVRQQVDPEQQTLRHILGLPEWAFEDVPPNFALIRRRRPVFDVLVPGGEPVRVFKQSVGLLVLSQLPGMAREAALRASWACPDYDGLDEVQRAAVRQFQQRASEVAGRICGAVFERAIREREQATAVVPLSMQYIMKARRLSASDLTV